ncbi:MAG: CRISPR-associated endonuclease Cas3'' [Pseudobdellovibrio sp.]
MNKWLANSHKQPLSDHLLGVAKRADQILLELSFETSFIKDFKIRECLFYSSILHDIGKISSDFQNYIQTKKNDANAFETDAEYDRNPVVGKKKQITAFDGPFHNEISWAIFRSYFTNFLDKQILKTAGYSIYWHHPANIKENGDFAFSDAEKILNIANISNSDISDLIDELNNRSKNLPFYKKLVLTECTDILEIAKPDYFDSPNTESAVRKLVLNILIEADREISSLSSEQLLVYIDLNSKLSENVHTKVIHLKKLDRSDLRSNAQHELAVKIRKFPISICGIDPGDGKTRITLITWINNSNNERKLLFALPRQAQVTGLYYTVKKDLESILAPQSKVEVNAIFNGKVQHSNWNHDDIKLLQADINILVFDRLLSPSYERKQVSEFMTMLRSDLAVDEFHEFSYSIRMLPALKEILYLRQNFSESGPKTILLSGTPDPALVKLLSLNPEKYQTLNRNELDVFVERKFKIKFGGNSASEEIKPRMLISTLTVKKAQENYIAYINSGGTCYLIHSSFTEISKKEKIELLLIHYGKDGLAEGVVFAARMLQSSFDLNFQHGSIATSVPSVDIQTLGRINRFGNQMNSTIHFYSSDEDKTGYFKDNKFGYENLHIDWNNYLNEKILKIQNNLEITFRELVEILYDDFWTEERIKNVATKMLEYESKEHSYLKNWFPKRFKVLQTKNSLKKNNLKLSFREVSLLASARIVNDHGMPIGILKDEELISASGLWKIKCLNDVLKTVHNSTGMSTLNNSDNCFNYSKYSRWFGSVDTPLLFSHQCDAVNSKLLREFRTPIGGNLYRVYHKDLGLVDPEVLKLLKASVIN